MRTIIYVDRFNLYFRLLAQRPAVKWLNVKALADAFQGNFDVAAVHSNDSDLVEPMRIVIEVLGKPAGLPSPVSNPTSELKNVASFIRRISVSDLAGSQFPDPVVRADGSPLNRPATWV